MIKFNMLTCGICLSLASGTLFAHAITPVEGEVEASGDGYITVGDNVLKTGLNECVYTSNFSEDNAINVCEGIEDEVEEEPVAEAEPEPEPEPAPQKSRISTQDFSEMALFDFDSDQLNATGAEVMEGLVAKVAEFKGVSSITVTGHTDSTGDDDYNMALSERRATTIANMLSEYYPDAAINAVGKGEAEPLESNDTQEGRSKNRRVEVDLTATSMTFE